MAEGKILEVPNDGINAGNRDINSTIVDSGLMIGENVWTLSFSADLVTSNTFDLKVNASAITQVTFATDNNTTIAAVATNIAAKAWVASAVVTNSATAHNNTIVIKGKPNCKLALTDAAVAAGASQATPTVTELLAIRHIPAVTTVGNTDIDWKAKDVASGTVTYYGYAVPGSDPAYPVWKIVKEIVSGAVTTRTYPGDARFAYIWNSRTGYTYA
jgi:hypothetical protein